MTSAQIHIVNSGVYLYTDLHGDLILSIIQKSLKDGFCDFGVFTAHLFLDITKNQNIGTVISISTKPHDADYTIRIDYQKQNIIVTYGIGGKVIANCSFEEYFKRDVSPEKLKEMIAA